jgi:hypothetical protein
MIADKLIPAFYHIELKGDAIKSIMGYPDIELCTIKSQLVKYDITAMTLLGESMQKIVNSLPYQIVEEKSEYNPEFFPSMEPLIPTRKDLDEINIREGEIAEMNVDATPIPTLFDDMGDFVEGRWTVKSDNFSILGRVVVNPEIYMEYKKPKSHHELDNKIMIH